MTLRPPALSACPERLIIASCPPPSTRRATRSATASSGVIDLIRPAVQADGGDIEVVDITPDLVVQIRFHGACHGCPSSTMTLQMGIERNLKEKVPEVTRVIPVQ